MIKTIALKSILDKALVTLRRFPLPLFIAISASIALLWMLDHRPKDANFLETVHFVITLSLALPAYTGLCFFTERYTIKPIAHFFAIVLLFALAVWYFYSIPIEMSNLAVAKYFILSLALHLWVAFAPFVKHREIQGFWQYNKSLFLRFLTASLYSGVLFGGLALAIVAVDQLFEAHIADENYARLWILIATVFNTWFFLSDLPEDVSSLNPSQDYPKGLRVFTQFVLLPLVTIYLMILYVYMFKILVTANWPQGWVSYLVIGFSTAGILALLLVWPLQNDERYKWIKVYVKYFFLALFPLILMLGFSIYIRVSQYGITENRYFIVVLALWLLVNAIYFLTSSVKNIKVIPMTLFFAAIFSGFGPWSAFSISESSQVNRLMEIAEKNAMWKDSKIIPAANAKAVSDTDVVEMSSIVSYLIEMHGTKSLQSIFTANLDSISEKEGSYNVARETMRSLNLEYKFYYTDVQVPGPNNYKDFNYTNNAQQQVLSIDGYSHFINMDFYEGNDNFNKVLKLNTSIPVEIFFNDESNVITVVSQSKENLEFNLDSMFTVLYTRYKDSNYSTPLEFMTITKEGESARCKLLFYSLNGKYIGNKKIEKVNSFRLLFLYDVIEKKKAAL